MATSFSGFRLCARFAAIVLFGAAVLGLRSATSSDSLSGIDRRKYDALMLILEDPGRRTAIRIWRA